MTERKQAFGPYAKGDPRAAEAGRRGGQKGAATRRANRITTAPYAGTTADLMDTCLLIGEDWAAWRAILKACFCLPLTALELATFQKLTGLDAPPETPVLELWLCCGRRAGKSTIAALLAFYKGITANPGTFANKDELIVLPVIASDRKQSRVLLGHLRSFARQPELRQYVAARDVRDTIELNNGIVIEVQTSNSRSVRGYTSVALVLDEVAFWPTEGSDPADEIIDALRPTMGTVPEPLLVALSNPYEPRGPLFDAVNTFYGQPNDEGILVVVADTMSLHPSFNRAVITRAFRRDAVKAGSEYGDPDAGTILFRQGSSALFDQAPIDAAIATGIKERVPGMSNRAVAFLDAAQGARSGDSMTLCIGHAENGQAVIDKLVERRPPFDPMVVLVTDFAPVLRAYGIRKVVGDRVASGFVESTLRTLGFTFEVSTADKSALYLNLLNVVNSGGVSLLDEPTTRLQLLALQRFPQSGGRDRVDHPKGKAYHDDCANVVAGVVALCTLRQGKTIHGVFSGMDEGGRTDQQALIAAYARQALARIELEQLDEERAIEWRKRNPTIFGTTSRQ